MADEAQQGRDLLTQGARLGRASSLIRGGTPMSSVRAIADTAAAPLIDRQAKKFAQKRAASSPKAPKKKKLTGIGFWVIVGVALMKDSLDIILNLSVFLIFLVIPLSFLFMFITFMYLHLEGVKVDSRKLATIILSFLVDMLPLLSMLPAFTLSFFIIRFLENSKQGGGILGSVAKRTPVGKVLAGKLGSLR